MLQFAIPCLLGLESLVGDEVKKLGLADVRVENGRVLCRGEERDLARLNINLRCGARVLLVLASFRATDFETLFQGTRAVRWEDWIPPRGRVPRDGLFHQLHAALRPRLPVHREEGGRRAARGGLWA